MPQEQITIGSRILVHDASATTILLKINDDIEIVLDPSVIKKLAGQLEVSANIATFLERYRLMLVSNNHTPYNAALLTRELLRYMGGLHDENSQATSKRATLSSGDSIP